MPNQRKKGLILVGAYVTEKQHADLKKEAKTRGVTLADLIRAKILKDLEER